MFIFILCFQRDKAISYVERNSIPIGIYSKESTSDRWLN